MDKTQKYLQITQKNHDQHKEHRSALRALKNIEALCERLTHSDCKNEQIQAIDRKVLLCLHFGQVNLSENKLPR